jgi:hypothetical protein
MATSFEYRVFLPESDGWRGERTLTRLNELGAEGWRVVAPITDSEPMGTAHATYSFTGALLLERSREN